jgi:hypothetical protein
MQEMLKQQIDPLNANLETAVSTLKQFATSSPTQQRVIPPQLATQYKATKLRPLMNEKAP